jgi:hypothetical protein
MTPDPFTILGLPAWPDLDDETVHAAWQAIAAETHPDRPGGGDLARYTQASAAYAALNTAWGRSEAYADLAEQARAESLYGDYPDTHLPDDEPVPVVFVPVVLVPQPVPLREVLRMLAEIPVRIRHGHPVRLAIRAAVIAALCVTVLAVFPSWAFPDFTVVALIGVFFMSGREDLAPPDW